MRERKGSRGGQREKQGSRAVTAEAPGDLTARPEDGMSSQGKEARLLCPLRPVPGCRLPPGRAYSWAVHLPSAKGSFWKGLHVNSQQPMTLPTLQLGE